MSINSQWLYNALQREQVQVVLVDCRDYEEYEQQHIVTSVCMPPEMGLNEDGEEDFVDLTEIDTGYFRQPSHFDHYETRDQKHLIVYNNNDHNMWIGHVISCMDVEGRVVSVQALEEGFSDFCERYPFMCTTEHNPSSVYEISGFPFPVEIAPGRLYLARPGPVPSEHLEKLRIQVLFSVDNRVSEEDRIVAEQQGVTVHSLPLPESLTEEGCTSFWRALEGIPSEQRILLHSSNEEILIGLATFYFLLRRPEEVTNLREAYHLALQSYWRVGASLHRNSLLTLANIEKKELGSSSIDEEEINSSQIPEVPASSCVIS